MSNRVSILRPTYTFTDLILHLAHLHGNAGFVATHVFTPFLLQLISREMAVGSPDGNFQRLIEQRCLWGENHIPPFLTGTSVSR
jgi:hypothetical protein